MLFKVDILCFMWLLIFLLRCQILMLNTSKFQILKLKCVETLLASQNPGLWMWLVFFFLPCQPWNDITCQYTSVHSIALVAKVVKFISMCGLHCWMDDVFWSQQVCFTVYFVTSESWPIKIGRAYQEEGWRRGCIKGQYKINKDFFLFFSNCECKASLVESQNKNIELEMSVIDSL